MARIVIVGNGIAGITAARHVRKLSDHDITVISSESKYFFSRTALMYIYMGHMKFEHTKPYEDGFWAKNRIELLEGRVTEIKTQAGALFLDDGSEVNYDHLVLATGSSSRFFNWPGQDLAGVSGLYSLQDLQYIEEQTKNVSGAAIVGGGLIGIELAEMLHSRGIHVTFLVREKNFWDIVLPKEEAEMINEEILDHGIDLKLETELSEIRGDSNGHVNGVLTSEGEEISVQFVGLTTGVMPNIHWLKESDIETNRGILVDDYLRTNVDNIYAIGDCAELRSPLAHRRAIEPVWYVGRMMGETVAHTLCDRNTAYKPGVWFNSAKFFNIEYQTYGMVEPVPNEETVHFIWQSDDRKKLLRIAYCKDDNTVQGVNIMGLRSRHEVWNNWIKRGTSIDHVVRNLKRANFDPEFYKRYEQEIDEYFFAQNPHLKEELTPSK